MKDKETLSDKECIMDTCFRVYKRLDVRGFIQWVLDEISAFGKFERINGAKTNGLKYRIKKRAGEELINPTTESPNFRGLPDTTLSNHIPQFKGSPIGQNSEDTRNTVSPSAPSIKGCGKEFDNTKLKMFMTCGQHGELCPACSGEEDE